MELFIFLPVPRNFPAPAHAIAEIFQAKSNFGWFSKSHQKPFYVIFIVFHLCFLGIWAVKYIISVYSWGLWSPATWDWTVQKVALVKGIFWVPLEMRMQKATWCCTFEQEHSVKVTSISSTSSFQWIQEELCQDLFMLCTAGECGDVFLSPKKKATSRLMIWKL